MRKSFSQQSIDRWKCRKARDKADKAKRDGEIDECKHGGIKIQQWGTVITSNPANLEIYFCC